MPSFWTSYPKHRCLSQKPGGHWVLLPLPNGEACCLPSTLTVSLATTVSCTTSPPSTSAFFDKTWLSSPPRPLGCWSHTPADWVIFQIQKRDGPSSCLFKTLGGSPCLVWPSDPCCPLGTCLLLFLAWHLMLHLLHFCSTLVPPSLLLLPLEPGECLTLTCSWEITSSEAFLSSLPTNPGPS